MVEAGLGDNALAGLSLAKTGLAEMLSEEVPCMSCMFFANKVSFTEGASVAALFRPIIASRSCAMYDGTEGLPKAYVIRFVALGRQNLP